MLSVDAIPSHNAHVLSVQCPFQSEYAYSHHLSHFTIHFLAWKPVSQTSTWSLKVSEATLEWGPQGPHLSIDRLQATEA